MSHRLFRGTAVPFASTLAAAAAVLGVLGYAPETFGLSGFSVRTAAASDAVRAQERAVALAAVITSPGKPAVARTSAAPSARPTGPARQAASSPAKATGSALAGSLVKFVVAGLVVLIVLLTGLLVLMRSRRARGGPPGTARAHTRGQHEHRRSAAASVPGHGAAEPDPPEADSPSASGLPAQGAPPSQVGWQGGSLGESNSTGAFRPAMTPVPRSMSSRSGRAAGSSGRAAGPPWEPARPPERMPGPLPVVSRGTFPQGSVLGIRVPRDMTALPAARADAPPPFDSPGLDTPAAVTDFPTRPDLPAATDLPTRQSLGFAAAPVASDYAPPEAPADHAASALPAEFTVHHEAPQGSFAARPAVPDLTAPPGTGVMPGPETSGPPAAPDSGAPPDLTGSPAGADLIPADPPPPAQPSGASYIWDLAATDVFPATDSAAPPPAPGAVPPQEAPGASGG